MSGLNKTGNGVIAFGGQTLVNREKGFYIACNANIGFVSDPLAEMELYAFLADSIRSSLENRSFLEDPIMNDDSGDYPLVHSDLGSVEFCTEASNFFPHTRSFRGDRGIFLKVLVLAFVSPLDGGAHATAWNSHCLTDRQRLLWGLSALAILCPTILFLCAGAPIFLILLVQRGGGCGGRPPASGISWARFSYSHLVSTLH